MIFRLLWLFLQGRTTSGTAKAVVLFVLLLWYSTAGFLYFELPAKPDLGWGDGLWWSLVTMATVGYGDIFPATTAGRFLVGVPTMVFGIGFLGYLISTIAGSLLESRSRRLKGMMDLKLADHILLVNYNGLDTLLKLVHELRADPATHTQPLVLVDETLAELPPELADLGVHFVKGDPTRDETLARASAATATHAIVLAKEPGNPHSDDHNLVTTLVLESLNPRLFSVVEVISPGKIRQVELAGADSVICAAQLTSGLIVQELQDPGVKDLVLDLLSDLGGHQFYVAPLGTLTEWTYAELVRWGLSHRVTVLGIRRQGKDLLGCAGEEKVLPTDRVLLIGAERVQIVSTAAG
ncbi:MAG: NAD-binding protein [Deltaproteobacteria bacterium]|nr:NAD-binding protein [Deltaproteobacteria bacterium]